MPDTFSTMDASSTGDADGHAVATDRTRPNHPTPPAHSTTALDHPTPDHLTPSAETPPRRLPEPPPPPLPPSTPNTPTTPLHLARAGVVAVLASVAVIGALDLWTAAWPRSPIVRTISEYQLGPLRPVFDTAVVVLVAGTVAVLASLVSVRLIRLRSATAITLLLWSAGLLAVVAFQKHDWSVGPSWHGYVHQLGSLTAFLALPVAALSLARAARRAGHARASHTALAWLGRLSYAWFALIPAAIVYAEFTGGRWWAIVPLGLTERLLTLTEVCAVIVMASCASRAARLTAPANPRTPARAAA